MGDVHHCSRAPVSEMTYTVSSGTLNSTIPYHTIPWTILLHVAQSLAAPSNISIVISDQSTMSLIQVLLGLPLHLVPSVVPVIKSFSKPLPCFCMTCPKQQSFLATKLPGNCPMCVLDMRNIPLTAVKVKNYM